jgi:cell division protein FtsI/penicillin-binding protein 2
VAVLALASFAAGLIAAGGSDENAAAARFMRAWEQGDYAAMHDELTPDSAKRHSLASFTDAYARARATATVVSLDAGSPSAARTPDGREVASVPVTVRTRAFGRYSGRVLLPVADDGVEWSRDLVFPGLASGERLTRTTRAPERAPILARDGTPLAEGPGDARTSPLGAAALDVAGTMAPAKARQADELRSAGFPPATLVGSNGLELAFNERLAGQPGGVLEAEPRGGGAARPLASAEPRDGRPVHTTIDPTLQQAAVVALGDTYGGAAVLDARDGSIRALAGIAFSAPQPPGSTFKVVTTTAALDAGIVSLGDEFPVVTSATVGGRAIANAHDEPCGGTFAVAFARSCNSVFAPLGAKLGGERLVQAAERFGFNSPPALYGAAAAAAISPASSSIPRTLGSDLDAGVSAIGQGLVQATPLEMASVSQTIANEGVRSPTSIVADRSLRADAEPVRVTSPETAATVRQLMIGVVNGGTGTAAAIPGVQVAGKTGTAELGPKALEPGEERKPGETPEQEVDAWFTAFAPASDPRLAVAVMVVNACGDGGVIAAPIAREILAAGLQ